jgi:hypothetical protein
MFSIIPSTLIRTSLVEKDIDDNAEVTPNQEIHTWSQDVEQRGRGTLGEHN